ncbi:hypothetical protein [Clostridium perfringens]|jgi:hypothetical protein|uniref:DUF2642 domain-containing protein n=1 Tax=Clostridium perfringens TaxID=1502 RepID=A0AAW4IXW7_CLOPF|nr:hypothetical protein [Clostridium perfringens]MBO3356193.1 hypothetical protein [Clostridium perfringens]MBO3359466.1 hypothetical protein [Clostridium perfringens]
MENIKKDEWLHEEFGIKVNNRYICIRKNDDRIVGQILNFSPRSNIAIKCEDGLHIIPYKEILELRPLPIEKERFKVGDYFELKQECIVGDLVVNNIIATTIFYKGINGIIYYVDKDYIYVNGNQYGKFRIEKRRL